MNQITMTDKMGEMLRKMRTDEGIKLVAAAKRAGISASYLSDLEHGRTMPSLHTLNKIAQSYGHTLHVGMREDDEQWFPCTSFESAALFSLRAGDLRTFLIMVAAAQFTDSDWLQAGLEIAKLSKESPDTSGTQTTTPPNDQAGQVGTT